MKRFGSLRNLRNKRFLSMILSVSLIIGSTLSVYGAAEGDTNYPAASDSIEGEAPVILGAGSEESGECGDDLSWSFDGETLTFSGTGKMDDYKEDEDETAPWKSLSVKKVVFEKGITRIGSYAFKDMDSIEEMQLPIGLKEIGDFAFANCSGLKGDLTLPALMESLGVSAFSGCSSLDGILRIREGLPVIPEKAFENCGFKSIYLPDTLTVIKEKAFWGVEGMTALTIPENVYEIDSFAFYCSPVSLKSVYFEGDAPQAGADPKESESSLVFGSPDSGFRIYYEEGTSGWKSSWSTSYKTEKNAGTVTGISANLAGYEDHALIRSGEEYELKTWVKPLTADQEVSVTIKSGDEYISYDPETKKVKGLSQGVAVLEIASVGEPSISREIEAEVFELKPDDDKKADISGDEAEGSGSSAVINAVAKGAGVFEVTDAAGVKTHLSAREGEGSYSFSPADTGTRLNFYIRPDEGAVLSRLLVNKKAILLDSFKNTYGSYRVDPSTGDRIAFEGYYKFFLNIKGGTELTFEAYFREEDAGEEKDDYNITVNVEGDGTAEFNDGAAGEEGSEDSGKKITLNKGGSKTVKVVSGASFTMILKPDKEKGGSYAILDAVKDNSRHIKKGSKSLKASGDDYIFYLDYVDRDHAIDIKFRDIEDLDISGDDETESDPTKTKLTLISTGEGTIEWEGESRESTADKPLVFNQSVPRSSTYRLRFMANGEKGNGWEIESIKINGEEKELMGADGKPLDESSGRRVAYYTLLMDEDQNVEVKFKELVGSTHKVSLTASTGGRIFDGSYTVRSGETVNYRIPEGKPLNLSFKPDAGYTVKEVVINGVNSGTPETYKKDSLDGDISVLVAFEQINYNINIVTVGEGLVRLVSADAASKSIQVSKNASVEVEIVPGAGYELDYANLDGTNIKEKLRPAGSTIDGSDVYRYTFENVESDHLLECFFTEGISGGFDGSVFVTWTRTVSYNGRSHIESTSKKGSSKTKCADIDIKVTWRHSDGKMEDLTGNIKRVKFKNNKRAGEANGNKGPGFYLKFRNVDKEVAKKFAKYMLPFTINKASISSDNIMCSGTKTKSDGSIKLGKLYYLPPDSPGTKVKMKFTKDTSRTDYVYNVSTDKQYVIVTGANNYTSDQVKIKIGS